MTKQYGIDTIYLSTDDGHIFPYAQKAWPQYRWVYRHGDRSFYDPDVLEHQKDEDGTDQAGEAFSLLNLTHANFDQHGVNHMINAGIVNGVDETLNIMTDLDLMSGAYALVVFAVVDSRFLTYVLAGIV